MKKFFVAIFFLINILIFPLIVAGVGRVDANVKTVATHYANVNMQIVAKSYGQDCRCHKNDGEAGVAKRSSGQDDEISVAKRSSGQDDTISVAKTSSEKEGVCLPIIMYHSINNRQSRYVLSESAFQSDLNYLKSNGYHTITISDLLNFQNNAQVTLPTRPIILSFDDGFYNNFSVVMPLLKSYGFRAVISVTGEFLDKERNATCRNNFYSMLKYSELKQMTDSGIFEVQNHCYNFHHIRNGRVGIKNKPNEDLQQYVQLLKADTFAMQNKIKQMTGKVARCYTYPYGMYSSVTVNALKELGFECMMTCQEGVNFVSKTSSLFYLKRLERSDTKPLSAMLRNL